MKYYGIKTPHNRFGVDKSYIWWIGQSEHESWMMFFTQGGQHEERNAHRLPLEEAIRAYKAIGYKCVELEVTEKVKPMTQEEFVNEAIRILKQQYYLPPVHDGIFPDTSMLGPGDIGVARDEEMSSYGDEHIRLFQDGKWSEPIQMSGSTQGTE